MELTLEERMIRVETQIANLYSIIKFGGGLFGTIVSGLLTAILITMIRK